MLFKRGRVLPTRYEQYTSLFFFPQKRGQPGNRGLHSELLVCRRQTTRHGFQAEHWNEASEHEHGDSQGRQCAPYLGAIRVPFYTPTSLRAASSSVSETSSSGGFSCAFFRKISCISAECFAPSLVVLISRNRNTGSVARTASPTAS